MCEIGATILSERRVLHFNFPMVISTNNDHLARGPTTLARMSLEGASPVGGKGVSAELASNEPNLSDLVRIPHAGGLRPGEFVWFMCFVRRLLWLV